MSEKKQKKKLFVNSRARNIFLTVGGIAVGMVGLSILIGNNNAGSGLSSEVSAPEGVSAVPGGNTQPRYVQAVREENNERADAAVRSGQSALPTITGSDPAANPATGAVLYNPFEINSEPPATQTQTESAQMEPFEGQPAIPIVAPAAVQYQAPREVNPAMQSQMRALMERWGAAPQSVSMTLNTAPVEREVAVADSGGAGAVQAGSQVTGVPPMYRAGDIIPAVIDTELSTDYPGKVRATIVSGPLRGAYVIGDFSRQRDTVLLQFNMMSIAGQGTVATQMVAVDPNTGNSGIQSDVDHHYLSRYASLMGGVLARSLGVYAELTLEEGETTITSGSGNVITSRPTRESNERTRAALAGGIGRAADDLSDDIRDGFNREPTVRVFQQEPVGLFVLQDIPGNILTEGVQ